MRKYFVLLFISISCSVFGQTFHSITDYTFFPTNFRVGDPVQLRIYVESSATLDSDAVIEIEENQWFDWTSLSAQPNPDGYMISLDFISFSPGTRSLPEIRVGDTVLTTDIKVYTESILERENSSFVPIMGQLFLPGTKLIIAALVMLLLIGPVGGTLLVRRLQVGIDFFLKKQNRQRPVKIFKKKLLAIMGQAGKISPRDFYFSVSELLRTYLTQRLGLDFMTATTSDFYPLLYDFLREDGRYLLDQMENFMIFADEVKFGGKRASRKRQRHDGEFLSRFASKLEDLLIYYEEEAREDVR